MRTCASAPSPNPTGDKKQALYNLFAAYIHTVPLELLRVWNERGEKRKHDMAQQQDGVQL